MQKMTTTHSNPQKGRKRAVIALPTWIDAEVRNNALGYQSRTHKQNTIVQRFREGPPLKDVENYLRFLVKLRADLLDHIDQPTWVFPDGLTQRQILRSIWRNVRYGTARARVMRYRQAGVKDEEKNKATGEDARRLRKYYTTRFDQLQIHLQRILNYQQKLKKEAAA